jgi:DNA-binding response OmpR family regulator
LIFHVIWYIIIYEPAGILTGLSLMASKRGTGAVLIIEDEVNIQNFISRTLELEGYDVYRTADGARGLEIIRNDDVSLVLLDLRLPTGPDGWSILREIKRDARLSAIPVVVLTASAEVTRRRRTLRLGAAGYLIKPVSAHHLTQAVRDALRKKLETPVPGRAASPAPR